MKLVWTILLVLTMQWALPQDTDEMMDFYLEENDISKKLPPLDTLIQRAFKQSAQLKRNYADQEYFKGLQRLAQTRWLDYFYLEAVYNYGVFDNLTAQQLTGAPQSTQTLLSTVQDRYTFGPSMKIPLSAIFNRKNDIRAGKSEYKRSVEEAGIFRERVQDEVIKRYSEVLKVHRLLYVHRTITDAFKVQSLRAEKEYVNGVIEVAEYTRLHQMYNESIVALEGHKADLSLAILLLEAITGMKFEI